MLLLVYHHLGDSWKSAREASTSRLLCFTTGFPGAPNGSSLQPLSNRSNPVHRCGISFGPESQWITVHNPYSESQFRTMKYRPEFPDRFGCIQDSRAFAQGFFRLYNEEHYHYGLALLTPAMVHYQQTGPILQQRQQVLDVAYQLHPERFVRRAPKPAAVPTEVWINNTLNLEIKTQ